MKLAWFFIFLMAWLLPPGVQAAESLPMATAKMKNTTGVLVHKDGYRIKWQAPEIKTVIKTGFNYVQTPNILIYVPGKKEPIKIVSQRMKIDTLSKDFILEDDVTVYVNGKTLKTGFMNFNAQRMELRSFDKFIYETNEGAHRGHGFHGLFNKNRRLTLYHVDGRQRRILKF